MKRIPIDMNAIIYGIHKANKDKIIDKVNIENPDKIISFI
jgi:hypothetical protein